MHDKGAVQRLAVGGMRQRLACDASLLGLNIRDVGAQSNDVPLRFCIAAGPQEQRTPQHSCYRQVYACIRHCTGQNANLYVVYLRRCCWVYKLRLRY